MIINKGIVFKAEKGTNRQSCAFPGVGVLPNGRWLGSCRAAPTKGGTVGQDVLITWSDDEGRSWHKPVAPFVPPSVNNQPGLFRGGQLTALGGRKVLAVLYWVDHSEPSLPFFNEETEGLLDSRIFLSESNDGGEKWSMPKLVNTSPFNIPTPITGPILLLPNGDWASQFELNKRYYDKAVWRHSSVLIFSKDGGKSWPEYVITSNDPENRIFYWDQRPNVLSDGKILDLFWTYDNHRALYINIHGRESLDNGRNWSAMWDTGVSGQPAPPVSLRDGRIAMAYVDRTGMPTIKMRISEDGGRNWRDETEIILYGGKVPSQTVGKKSMQDAWAEMAKFSIGLPTTALLKNGDLLVVYYAGTHLDFTDIYWVRIRVE